MTVYFWFDDAGWWWGDPAFTGNGPWESFEQMMYRYRGRHGRS